jgi:hypothetical protein
MTNGKFVIVDNDFNRENYPTLIGQEVDSPPAYAGVLSERQRLERKSDADLEAYQRVLLISVPEPLRSINRRHRRIVAEILLQRKLQMAEAA